MIFNLLAEFPIIGINFVSRKNLKNNIRFKYLIISVLNLRLLIIKLFHKHIRIHCIIYFNNMH
jgi:hypothetical protein